MMVIMTQVVKDTVNSVKSVVEKNEIVVRACQRTMFFSAKREVYPPSAEEVCSGRSGTIDIQSILFSLATTRRLSDGTSPWMFRLLCESLLSGTDRRNNTIGQRPQTAQRGFYGFCNKKLPIVETLILKSSNP